MRCSNSNNGLLVAFNESEDAAIRELFSPDLTFLLKQQSPGSWGLLPDPKGNKLYKYMSSDHPSCINVGKLRPGFLKKKSWGMAEMVSSSITKDGVFFTPDTSHVPVKRGRIQTVQVPSEAPQLKDVIEAVAKINQFVAENEEHVVLSIVEGRLKFLVEG